MKILAVALLATSFLTGSALAQTAPAPATTTTTTTTQTTGGQWRVSKLMGLDIYNDQNEKLGDVTEVLVGTTGKVAGVVIGVGGFLGMGQRDIMVPMEKLKFVNEPARVQNTGTTTTQPTTTTTTAASKWYPDHAILSGATKDSLKAMAEFKYD